MRRQRNFLLFIALPAVVAAPALGQTVTSGVGPASGVTNGAASIPDFSRTWNHPAFPWFEPPASGPGPVTNKSRWPQRPGDASVTLALPPLPPGVQGVSDYDQLVGDHTNPILQPWAAEVVRKFGEMSLAGKGYPTPRNQCWPEQVPFVFINYGMQMLQRPDKVTFLYPFDHQFRQVRLNQSHAARVTPSWYGDSVGHYEGEELVIDTVGVKVGPFSMLDWYGTPYSEALHLVERYRLLDYEATMNAVERDAKEHLQTNN